MKSKIKNEILRLLADRSPNYVRKEIIVSRLNKYPQAEVDQAIDSLIQEQPSKIVVLKGAENSVLGIKLANDNNIPVRRYIKIGDIEVPRILVSDQAQLSLEDINESIERLAEHNDKLEDRYRVEMEKATERYWGNVISLFGIFVAIFSLINLAIPRKEIPACYSFEQSLMSGLAQSIPIAIVLSIFVLVLVKIFRQK